MNTTKTLPTQPEAAHTALASDIYRICKIYYADQATEQIAALIAEREAANLAKIAALTEAIEAASGPLMYGHEVFNDNNFTDRHRMGPEFTKAVRLCRAALKLASTP